MALFDFLRRPSQPEAPTIPIFPLKAVLFPGGILGLKVFETRYLDMASNCLHQKIPFGVCLISAGGTTDTPLKTQPVGTLANILTADMDQAGVLLLSVQGGQRFRVLETTTQSDGLQRAHVEFIADAENIAVPPQRHRLLPLLLRIVADLGPEKIPEPHPFESAEWVGYRLTETLPIQNLAKQKILELIDPLARLEILEKYLDQRKLLTK